MAIISDIRIYRCKVENITRVWPEAFINKKLSAVARVNGKLNQEIYQRSR